MSDELLAVFGILPHPQGFACVRQYFFAGVAEYFQDCVVGTCEPAISIHVGDDHPRRRGVEYRLQFPFALLRRVEDVGEAVRQLI